MISKKIGLAVSLVFCLGIVAGPVAAQDGNVEEETTTTQATDDETTGSDRATRLEDYKTRVTDRITDAQATRLTNRCTAAQTRIAQLLSSDRTKTDARIAAYQNIVDKITEAVRKLQAANVDTTALEAALTDLQTQADALVAALRSYVAVLTDLAEMDCESDPEAFQAALSLAREARAELKTQAEAFRSFVTNDLKTVLQDLRQQLASDDGTAESTEE